MRTVTVRNQLENLFGTTEATKCIIKELSTCTLNIEVPILDSERDFIDFNIELLDSYHFKLSDNGTTLKEAMYSAGINYKEMSEHWNTYFSRILSDNQLEVNTHTDEISRIYPISELNDAVIFFPQALAAIDRLCADKAVYNQYTRKETTLSERVRQIFISHRFDFQNSIELRGKSGLNINIDYNVNNTQNNNSILVSILRKRTESDKRILLLEWNDIRNVSVSNDSKLLAIEEKASEYDLKKQKSLRSLMQKSGIILIEEEETEEMLEKLIG